MISGNPLTRSRNDFPDYALGCMAQETPFVRVAASTIFANVRLRSTLLAALWAVRRYFKMK